MEFRTVLDTEFIRSPDFQRPLELAEAMAAVGAVPFTVRRGGDQPEEIGNHVALLSHNTARREDKTLDLMVVSLVPFWWA